MDKVGSTRHAIRRHNDFRIKRKRRKEVLENMEWAINYFDYSKEEIDKIAGKYASAPAACSCAGCVRRKSEGNTYQEKKESERLSSLERENEEYSEGDEVYFPYADGLWWNSYDYEEWNLYGD